MPWGVKVVVLFGDFELLAGVLMAVLRVTSIVG
jgi:hypothetical protein